MIPPMGPGSAPLTANLGGTTLVPDTSGGQSLTLQAALYGALTSNPDLVTLRQGNAIAPSPESVEVARHFPVTLNPTLWIDYRPITQIPRDTFGSGSPAGGGGTTTSGKHFYHPGQGFFYISLRQPVELGHQTTSRYEMAKAAYNQQRWTVVQAELLALIQTYRFFQTAAYRRERLRVAQDLADFNDRMVQTLRRRLEANQVPAADVVLATVESRAARQMVQAARQDYVTALTDLRNQVGIPETAGAAEPLGEFTLPPYIPPLDEQAMINLALESRPEIQAARAQVAGTAAAVRLARGDRIPTPVVGPEYEIDEAGVQYVGFVWIQPIPYLNAGTPLLRQRRAEHQRACIALRQAEQRTVAQVRSAVSKWNGATQLVNETAGLTTELAREVVRLERLFEEGQTNLTQLMQARQRLIQLENSQLDAVWAATQAQADLLAALGAPLLINAMLNQASAASANPAAAPASNPLPPPPPPFAASPFRPPPTPGRANPAAAR
jgi:cobalt-zinc-cadmium efflux system outer membrane protein